MEAEMELEYSLVKAPHEGMNKVFRQSHKFIEKEMAQVGSNIFDLCSRPNISTNEAYTSLDKLVGKMQGLKRKMEESKKEEEGHIQRFRSRLEHIKTFYKNEDKDSLSRWNNIRVDRIMVDYMLREGLYDSAIRLAQEANITDLVDIDIFNSSKKVIEGLADHDAAEALQWCADNRSKLKKIKVYNAHYSRGSLVFYYRAIWSFLSAFKSLLS
jgi:macrophage erythroblast attacher